MLDEVVPEGERTMNAILRALLLTIERFGFACWVYVVAFQIFCPDSVYWNLAVWIPIRLDYFGEAAFILSALAFFIRKASEKQGTS